MAVAHFDVAVVGGGIAGVTAACGAAATGRSVVLLEQERELAYHTTSRSAAMFIENEGRPVFHRLSTASRAFFEADHPELDAPLLDPLPVLQVGTAENVDAFADIAAAATRPLQLLDGDELFEHCPVLRRGVVVVGLLEATAASVDVMALHQLFLRRARAAGAEVRRSAGVSAIDRTATTWHLTTAAGDVGATVLVNAAGAWGDDVAAMAGVRPVGLAPLRRTAFTARTTVDPRGWPFVYAPISHLHCYFKPEAGGQLLCSLSDETPSPPCDARPEEIDVARGLDHVNALTTLELRSVARTWAGLRTFAPDRDPVFGWDDSVEGFLWLVGQGGCGIVTSPAAGELVAALLSGDALPASIRATGLTTQQLAPRR